MINTALTCFTDFSTSAAKRKGGEKKTQRAWGEEKGNMKKDVLTFPMKDLCVVITEEDTPLPPRFFRPTNSTFL